MRWGVDTHSERACRVFVASAVTGNAAGDLDSPR